MLDTNLNVSDERIKGKFIVSNPNYKNSDKNLDLSLDATSVDRLATSGYKSNVTGFSVGTQFEFLDDLNSEEIFYLLSKEKPTVAALAIDQVDEQKRNHFIQNLALHRCIYLL